MKEKPWSLARYWFQDHIKAFLDSASFLLFKHFSNLNAPKFYLQNMNILLISFGFLFTYNLISIEKQIDTRDEQKLKTYKRSGYMLL